MSYQHLLNPENPEVTIQIKGIGKIVLQLFESIAPNSVHNFIHLAKQGYYTNLVFHRIITGFMIQGGWGEKPSCPIKGEFRLNGFDNPLKHVRGVISMARTSDPNSQTTQFFIMHQNAPHLDGSYAGFGGVTEGFDVIDQVATRPRDGRDRPLEDVVIEFVTVDLKGKSYPDPVCYIKN